MFSDFDDDIPLHADGRPPPEGGAIIADLRRAMGQLGSTDAIDTSAAMLAHEVAQPIAAAYAYLAVVRRSLSGEWPTPAGRSPLETIDLATECLLRAGRIIDDAKHAAAKNACHLQPVDLTDVIADVRKVDGVTWDFSPAIEVDPNAVRVLADPVQLGQVISNLIRNAADATAGQDERCIQLIAALNGANMVEVSVSDNGPGIAAGMRTRLFDPFASAKPNGLGLGLAICRTIVERHSGRIWAEQPQTGAAIRFTIPAA